MLTPKTIWHYRQNKLTLIVRDLVGKTHDSDAIYNTLLIRGVFKWFTVRRRLIKLKNHWKERLVLADTHWKEAKFPGDRAYLKGYRAALRECRREIRLLCHSPRWACPDNDRDAQQWLYRLEDKLKDRILNEEVKSSSISLVSNCEGASCEIPKDSVGNLRGIG